MYADSATPDITEALPAVFSSRTATATSVRTGFLWDYEIDGIGFQRKTGTDATYRRRSVPIQKQQSDTATDPGEHSLGGDWLRSQSSFHLGSGIKYYEPGDDKDTQYRFADSQGVDVWTAGEVKGLAAAGAAPTLPGGVGELDHGEKSFLSGDIYSARGSVYHFWASGQSLGSAGTSWFDTPTVMPAGTVTGTISGLCRIQDGVLISTSAGIYFWDIYYSDPWTVCLYGDGGIDLGTYNAVLKYLKGRILFAYQEKIWEIPLDRDGGRTVPSLAVNMSNSPYSFVWRGFADGPNCIYALGGGQIYRIGLRDNGSLSPTLDQPYEVARVPSGESIVQIDTYLNKYIALSTTSGLRMGAISSDGSITYGPILISDATGALAFWGDFLFVAGGSGPRTPSVQFSTQVYRVSLRDTIGSTPLAFPWAKDVVLPRAGSVSSISAGMFGLTYQDAPYISAVSQNTGSYTYGGLLIQDDSFPEWHDAWLKTGLIRYSTLENKSFRSIDINCDPTSFFSGAALTASVVADTSEIPLGTCSSSNPSLSSIGTGLSSTRQNIALKFTFAPEPYGHSPRWTATLNSYQVRATPSPPRTRQVQVPLSISDENRDANGGKFGTDFFGWERLKDLEAIEDAGQVITFLDRHLGETFQATVEQIDFVRDDHDGSGNQGGLGRKGMSGTCLLTMRKL